MKSAVATFYVELNAVRYTYMCVCRNEELCLYVDVEFDRACVSLT